MTADVTDPIAALYADHEHLVARLNDLEELCRKAEGGAAPAGMAGDLDAMAAVLREEIDVHSRKEEVGLFPILRRHTTPPGLIDTMLAEHAAIRVDVAAFVAGSSAWIGASGGADPQPWIGPARRVRGQLSMHMQKENLVLFPVAKRMLTPPEVDEVAQLFATCEAEPGGGTA